MTKKASTFIEAPHKIRIINQTESSSPVKYSATVLSGILASILVSSFVSQAYAADVTAFLVPSRNSAQSSFIGVKTVTLSYPQGSSISQALNGEVKRISFTLNGTAGQQDPAGVGQAIDLINEALIDAKSPVQASSASISYTAVLRGDASRATISYKTEIKPVLENYLLEDQGSSKIVDLEWRGITVNAPMVLNAPDVGQIDVNHPSGLLEALYPDIATQLLNSDARQVLVDPILNFEQFDAPLSSWHVLFDPVGAYGSSVGLQGTEGAQVLSVYSLGESSLREGTHEPIEKDASVTIDGANVRVHSTTPPPNAQLTIAGYSAVQESGGSEFAVITLEAPAGVQTSTGGFPIQVLLVLGGMMGAIAIFILIKARK
ncbi:MAG: hypothetical protein HRF40_13030 [Nitrososphaera sp.]|jgi:hypothetical protein